jgi:hypothetical protein
MEAVYSADFGAGENVYVGIGFGLAPLRFSVCGMVPDGGQRSASCLVCSNGKNASKKLREACRLQVVILEDAWYGRAVTSQVCLDKVFVPL